MLALSHIVLYLDSVFSYSYNRYVSQLCYLIDKSLNEVPHLSRIVVPCCLSLNLRLLFAMSYNAISILASKVKALQENSYFDEDMYVSQLCQLLDKILYKVPHPSKTLVQARLCSGNLQ